MRGITYALAGFLARDKLMFGKPHVFHSQSMSVPLHTGDDRTIKDLLVFLVRWMDRHPSYKGRPLFVTGESYAGATLSRATLSACS